MYQILADLGKQKINVPVNRGKKGIGCRDAKGYLFSSLCMMAGLFVTIENARAGGAGSSSGPVIPTWTVNLIVDNQSAKTVEGSVTSGGSNAQESKQSFYKTNFPARTKTTKTIRFQDKNPAPYKHYTFIDGYHKYCTDNLYVWKKRKNLGLPCVYNFTGDLNIKFPTDSKTLNINVTYGTGGFRLTSNTGTNLHKNQPNYDYKPRY